MIKHIDKKIKEEFKELIRVGLNLDDEDVEVAGNIFEGLVKQAYEKGVREYSKWLGERQKWMTPLHCKSFGEEFLSKEDKE